LAHDLVLPRRRPGFTRAGFVLICLQS
jgi:hypothetical protein